MRIRVFDNTLASNQEATQTEVCWQKKESIRLCTISSRRAFSTSVLSVIEVGVKKLHMVFAANDHFYGGASHRSPRGSYATAMLQTCKAQRVWSHAPALLELPSQLPHKATNMQSMLVATRPTSHRALGAIPVLSRV